MKASPPRIRSAADRFEWISVTDPHIRKGDHELANVFDVLE
jgi:hypothetical protein